jgi:hypothetical protein
MSKVSILTTSFLTGAITAYVVQYVVQRHCKKQKRINGMSDSRLFFGCLLVVVVYSEHKNTYS